MNFYEQMLSLLRRYHVNADGERLAGEMLIEGHNVVGDFLCQQVGAPWVWSPRMEEFYRTTDAFVYELLVWHHKPSRIRWREQVAGEIARLFPHGAAILCLGDGIGYDSLAIAAHLQAAQVTSFELPGYSSAFAARLIDDAGLSRRVSILGDPAALSANQYDVVVSLHVLEHVPGPLTMIGDIASYMRPGGCALISEAFSVVDPSHPTHLASNLLYAGRTIAQFEAQGMAFERMLPNWICVFKKGARPHRLNHPALRLKYRLAGIVARKRFARDYPYGTADLGQVIRSEAPMLARQVPNTSEVSLGAFTA